MSKFCPICNKTTNCTDNCASCLEEELGLASAVTDDEFHEELIIEQNEQGR